MGEEDWEKKEKSLYTNRFFQFLVDQNKNPVGQAAHNSAKWDSANQQEWKTGIKKNISGQVSRES